MANNENLKPFVKGDPRCWRKGRPKSFDAWRKLAQEVLTEPALDKNDNPIIVTDSKGKEHIATQAEMILREWLKDPRNRINAVEAAFGKVPQQIDMKTENKITVRLAGEDD